MENRLRLVTKIPLQELWDEVGIVPAERLGFLTVSEVKRYLRESKIQFIIAAPGLKLQWLNIENCYHNWQEQIKPNLIGNPEEINLDELPNGFGYRASEWRRSNGGLLILLEMIH